MIVFGKIMLEVRKQQKFVSIGAAVGIGSSIIYLLWRRRYRISATWETFVLHLKYLLVANDNFSHWYRIQQQISYVLEVETKHRLHEKYRIAGVDTPNPMKMIMPASTGHNADAGILEKDLVLVGGGHAHVHVLKSFGATPAKGVRLTVISRDIDTPYSGMLPGYIAGSYAYDECHIDLNKLANFAKCRLIHGEVVRIDTEKKLIYLRDPAHPVIRYDVCSIDIGSSPAAGSLELSGDLSQAGVVTPVKPINGFAARWGLMVQRVAEACTVTQIVVVGGGAGGVELVLSMQSRLIKELQRRMKDPNLVRFTLVTRSATLMGGHSKGVGVIFSRLLKERNIEIRTGCEVVSSTEGLLTTKSGEVIAFDECVWCTQASGQAWLRETGLALDESNFIKVQTTLESVNVQDVFAAGDIACMVDNPRPKAGVFAVRAGFPLERNLRRRLLEGPAAKLEAYIPQTLFLGLIGTGSPGVAVASRGPMAIEGDWIWNLKDWIDRSWMEMYSVDIERMMMMRASSPMAMPTASSKSSAPAMVMRCKGCGAKVGAGVLERAMKRLNSSVKKVREDIVIAGLGSPDDCAIVRAVRPGYVEVQTVDFFPAFISDPYLFGRIAANHALSDVHAMGADPRTALAIAVVPHASDVIVEDVLYQMMAGACQVLEESQCALVGGHTCEGEELALGFAITGEVSPDAVLRKGGMSPRDKLILSKAIGTGTILAADMRLRAKFAWKQAAISSMLQSNKQAARIFLDHKATALTDVTGFGLLGHLVEMTKASLVRVDLCLHRIPTIAGAVECIASGIASSLHDENIKLAHAVANPLNAGEAAPVSISSAVRPLVERVWEDPLFQLLFDPQTSGGLLATVPADQEKAVLAALHAAGYTSAACVGEVTGLCLDIVDGKPVRITLSD